MMVSVIVPCLNYADFIPDSVGSVLSQSHKNLELIFIDDKPFESLGNTDFLASWISTLMIRRERLGRLRFPPGVKLCEDYFFIMELYSKIRKAGYINAPLAKLRRHASNSYADAKEMFTPKIEAIRKLKQVLTHQSEMRILEQRLTDEYRHIAYHEFWYGSAFKAQYYSVLLLRRGGCLPTALKYLFLAPIVPLLRIYKKRRNTAE